MTAEVCSQCGTPFVPAFVLTLDEALRTGAIVRGMDVSEEEVKVAEGISNAVRAKVLQSGDEVLVRLMKTLPDESFGRLKQILDA